MDSFVLTMEYAVIIMVILLIMCLFSRHTNDTGNLNVFQRMPVLLPAIGFIVTVIIVTIYGFTPMGLYRGINADSGHRDSGYETDFVILDGFMYTESLEVCARMSIDENESVFVDVAVYQNESLVDTIHLNFQYSSSEYVASDEETTALTPGDYHLRMNYTYNSLGFEWDDPLYIQFTISQPLIEGFTQELVESVTYQFIVNISCIGIIIIGLGVGSSSKKQKKKDETDWKSTTEYKY